ncbi:MAG TPA: bifunctional indole-3-glycerol-phosphate synthase TrpC/phosphoribosylanthranilate isomerase TrpF [Ktedonobacteraceae bacterium]|jgi:indole-3-glycerol phosphate synthase/phosphoribosylanthranilate isomerase|nr:bifunctional indole-3-glycerol-phosphate synthase TrpC/phosphoribosylanthranilate isomerase TrpF [Ktedonobacteraceae bacterium]
MFLERIVQQTTSDLEQRKREIPLEVIQHQALAQSKPRDFYAALRSNGIKLIAEVKRASPSKGLLAPHLDPVEVACLYEQNGAAAISVLTEPHFFLGSPEYLKAIKQAVKLPVLRKDFILDPYQVYEARAWGADAILLICALLDDTQLRSLLSLAQSLGMHCLIEVHTAEETQRAVAAGAQIIGVNSRDLVTFQMYPNLLRELRPLIPPDRVVVAESGIHNEADARRIARYEPQAMLVGESLVVSPDIPEKMQALLRGANSSTHIKICGLRTLDHLRTAIEAGADMIGLVFYEPSHRYITPSAAKALVATIVDEYEGRVPVEIVGVFVNRELHYIRDLAQEVGLDAVQLHGDEPPEFCQELHVRAIKGLRLRSQDDTGLVRAYAQTCWRVLLDTPTPQWGGTGETHNWSLARQIAQEYPILLAGGLTPENVADAIRQVHPWGLDVSSGVETNRQKDDEKFYSFIRNARKVTCSQ